MANTFNDETLTWEVTETGTLVSITAASQFKRPTIRKIIYVPTTKGHDLVFQDSNSVNAIVLKAGATDASPIHVDFGERGKRVTGIQCTTIDSGTAYVYLA